MPENIWNSDAEIVHVTGFFNSLYCFTLSMSPIRSWQTVLWTTPFHHVARFWESFIANCFVSHPFTCRQVLWITSSFTSQNFLNQPFSFVLPGPLRSCFVNHPFSCRKVRKPFYESPLFFMLPGFENDLFVHSELFCEWPLLSFLSIISSFMFRFFQKRPLRSCFSLFWKISNWSSGSTQLINTSLGTCVATEYFPGPFIKARIFVALLLFIFVYFRFIF